MNKNRLLIGGSRAGQIVTVDEDLPVYSTPTTYRLSPKSLHDLAMKMEIPPAIQVEHYKLTRLQSGNRVIEVFVKDGLDPLEQLVSGYRPPIWEDRQ